MPLTAPARHRYQTTVVSLCPQEVQELDDFLGSEAAPSGLWGVDVLHGFLTSVALSPTATEVEEWLPLIWNTTSDSPYRFDDPVLEKRLTSYILRMYQDILATLEAPDHDFSPLVAMVGDPENQPYADGGMWCNGFMLGTVLLESQWVNFLATPAKGCLLLPIFLLGSEAVPPEWECMVRTPQQRAKLTEWIPAVVAAIHVKRLILELVAAQESKAAVAAVLDPCGCGSRKAFEFCCGAPQRLH